MRIAVLHISDLHCKESTSLKPASKVAACFREHLNDIDELIIAVTGDVSYSGHNKQYSVAKKYFDQLTQEITSVTGITPNIICVPGNHDCEHPKDTTLRDIVLDKIISKKGTVDSPDLIKQSISVQKNYFSWISTITSHKPISEEISWQIKLDKNIIILCYNSAWMSIKDEKQGGLYIPHKYFLSPKHGDIVITLMHHPYNWFEANNSRAIRNHLERVSDIILTGHEHDPVSYAKNTQEGVIEYIEGGVFHVNEHPNDSKFIIIFIDTSLKQYQAQMYKWMPEGYRSDGDVIRRTFIRASQKSSKYVLNPDFEKNFLRDMGTQLTHRAKAIEFDDLYTTPDLRKYVKLDRGDTLKKEIIKSEVVVKTVFSDKYVYFGGDSQSGKTSIAKHLYSCALQKDILPVYLEGEHIVSADKGSIKDVIIKAYTKQYSQPTSETFLQLPPERKCIIIDDFTECKLNRIYKATVLNCIREQYGITFVFGGNFSHIEEMLTDMEEGQMLNTYSHYEIMELGYLVRNKLIEKWMLLGTEHLTEKDVLLHQTNKVERHIDTILGKNLLPAYPIFILSMLQQIEAGTPVETKSGSYGYFYEVFITAALQKSSSSLDDIDTKYTYLSEFAWYLRSNKTRICNKRDITNFNTGHWTIYGLIQPSDAFTQELVKSQILVDHNGNIGFRHKYHYYYFLARYIRDNMSEPSVIDTIDECVNELHREECANVIIFITYLTKDKSIIDKLLMAAKDIYKDERPCDLDTHVSFLNKLYKRIPQISLPESDPFSIKKQKLIQIDSQQQQLRTTSETSGMTEEADEEGLNQMLAINRALKSIQILGQVLRNFSGSLKRPIKRELAAECFGVGLRTLNAYYGLIEKHLEYIIKVFGQIFDKKLTGNNPKEQVEIAKEIVFALTEILCFGMIHRISMAVGAEKLLPTYEDVQQKMNNLATEFVQVSIRMDHIQPFPERQVFDLYNKLKDNVFGQTLLRILVANHFYIFPEPRESRQRVCQRLKIAQTKKMLSCLPEQKFRK